MTENYSDQDMMLLKSWAKSIKSFYDTDGDGRLVKNTIHNLLAEKKDPKLYIGLWADNVPSLKPIQNLIKEGVVITVPTDEYPVPKTRVFLTRKGIELLATFRSFNDL